MVKRFKPRRGDGGSGIQFTSSERAALSGLSDGATIGGEAVTFSPPRVSKRPARTARGADSGPVSLLVVGYL